MEIKRKTDDELYHYGVIGMHWGVRRYQKKGGGYTQAGIKRYNKAKSEHNKTLDNASDYWEYTEDTGETYNKNMAKLEKNKTDAYKKLKESYKDVKEGYKADKGKKLSDKGETIEKLDNKKIRNMKTSAAVAAGITAVAGISNALHNTHFASGGVTNEGVIAIAGLSSLLAVTALNVSDKVIETKKNNLKAYYVKN